MILRKAAISLFCIFITLFLFIFLIRLSNNKRGFLGLNDLFSYFETVDMNKPIKRFSNDITTLSKSWNSVNNTSSNSSNAIIVNGTFSQVWQDLPASQQNDLLNNDFFKVVNVIAETIAFPFKLIGDFLLMVVDYITIFGNFISWIITFDGYIPSV